MLDANALEAAKAWYERHVGDGFTRAELHVFTGFLTAYLQAVDPEPAVAGVETCKFYHSQWPVEDRLKARGPYGLITDDGEAWRYEYTHSDADGGPYDVVCRPRSALVATPPAEPVVEAQIREVANLAFDALFNTAGASLARSVQQKILSLATKPAVKDDETVVEAVDAAGAVDAVTKAVAELQRRVDAGEYVIATLITNLKTGNCPPEKAVDWFEAEGRAALAAKDARS